jgi:Family of unknown function (DUF5519)
MKVLDEIERQIVTWPGVSVHAHRFGGREFRFRAAEVGHVHAGGIVDIPFPRSVRDALLEEGLAEEHHWVPNSGWITYRIRNENDLKHALWLLRLSYLRYTLKAAAHPRHTLESETETMRLSPRFRSLLEALIPKTAKSASAQPAPA